MSLTAYSSSQTCEPKAERIPELQIIIERLADEVSRVERSTNSINNKVRNIYLRPSEGCDKADGSKPPEPQSATEKLHLLIRNLSGHADRLNYIENHVSEIV